MRTAWIALTLTSALAACGPEATSPRGIVAADYFANFEYQAGSMATLDCADDSLDGVTPMTGILTLDGSTTAAIAELAQPGAPCPGLLFDLVDGVATARPNQHCVRTVNNARFDSLFTSYTMALDETRTMLVIEGLASANVTGAVTTVCTSTISAMALKRQ
ncbi:MAG: hypothetical protein KF773_27970 [Deltaproteobacteria bacterium]|nr:hypothetical protein [Deltaproteobacteria bacterium]MCW5803306.1 hypothetical protein [Deltaproteobacteria bacterium]